MNITRKLSLLAITGLLIVSHLATAQDETAKKDENSPEKIAAILGKLNPSVVRINYYLKYDKGDSPRVGGYVSSFGSRHFSSSGGRYVQEERPLEQAAYLIKADEVIASDIFIEDRFIEKITVSSQNGKTEIPAKRVAYAVDQPGVYFKLEKPLPNAKPLTFDTTAKGPYLQFGCGMTDGLWYTNVVPMSSSIIQLTRSGKTFRHTASYVLVITSDGTPVTLAIDNEQPLGDSWKTSPVDWKKIPAKDLKALFDKTAKIADKNILRVQLNFRSPKVDRTRRNYRDEDGLTEFNCLGIMLDPSQIAILAGLQAQLTARLEKITVHTRDGKTIPATFTASLKDYDGVLAKLERPLLGAGVTFAPGSVANYRNKMVIDAQIKVVGEQLVSHIFNTWVSYFRIGWKRQFTPVLATDDDNAFVFTTDGKLISMPLGLRSKTGNSRSHHTADVLMAVEYLTPVFADVAAATDKSNVPLSEAEENRIAWMGVELQQLNPELAKVNNVSEPSQNGNYGALITYVYPNSPAAKKGVEPGDILLRITSEDSPTPINVNYREYRRPFPWEQLDRIPEQYYDQIPTPWESMHNSFNTMLTSLGFSKKFKAEFFRDGKPRIIDFTVDQAPTHYETATKYKDKDLGIDVRNMTYEVRRYFQKAPDVPGVIISKVEQGSKASIAGIKPYEIITQVNGKPVANIDEFKKLTNGHKQFRLAIDRMSVSRVVSIDLKKNGSAKPE